MRELDAEFWHQRWENGQTAFHQPEGSLMLRRCCDQALPSTGTILVPLCGRSVDMIWLRDRGCRVLGVEVSPIAVRDFFRLHALQPASHDEVVGLTRISAAGVDILQGDFFSVTPALCGPVAGVYDRAALIALPPAMRPRYVEHLLRLAGSAPILLLTLYYPQEQMNGPPFSVAEEEVRASFESSHEVKLLASEDALPAEPRFRQRGLSLLEQSAWLLLPRS